MKLLIVDDSAMLRDMLTYALNEGGYTDVTECDDGTDGLIKAKSSQYDLIIADINMPNMDGLTMIKEIRKLSDYDQTPILILTTEKDEQLRQDAKDVGANGWITKPFVPDQLLKAVSAVLNKN